MTPTISLPVRRPEGYDFFFSCQGGVYGGTAERNPTPQALESDPSNSLEPWRSPTPIPPPLPPRLLTRPLQTLPVVLPLLTALLAPRTTPHHPLTPLSPIPATASTTAASVPLLPPPLPPPAFNEREELKILIQLNSGWLV